MKGAVADRRYQLREGRKRGNDERKEKEKGTSLRRGQDRTNKSEKRARFNVPEIIFRACVILYVVERNDNSGA